MADESSEARLEKRLDRIENLLVSRVELTMSVGHLQDQIRDLKDEIKGLRAEAASKEEVKQLQADKTARTQSNRSVFLGGVSAVVVAIIIAAISAWVTGKGGH